MTTFNLTCEAVETMLHEYLDETLEPWVRISIEEHLRDCARCTAFARELRNITGEAAALPALLPERDPWARIAGRIGVPVAATESVGDVEKAITPGPLADVAPITPTHEAIVSASDAPLPISESPAVAIKPSMSTAEPAVVTSELPMHIGELPMDIGELPMRMSEPPVLRSDEPPVLTSDGPPVLAIPVYVLPAPKEESVSEPVREPLPSSTPRVHKIAPLHARLGRHREKSWRQEWMGVAAAALVLVTAGTTFLVTKQWLGPARPPKVVSDAGTRSERPSAERGIRGPSTGREQVGRGPASDLSTLALPGQPGSAVTVSAASVAPITGSPEDVVYDKEIPVLQRIVRRQKAGLDTSTVAVIDKNLRALDAAIAQIRAALKKDPGSALLDEQASRALEMKVELLRRTAMLKSST